MRTKWISAEALERLAAEKEKQAVFTRRMIEDAALLALGIVIGLLIDRIAIGF